MMKCPKCGGSGKVLDPREVGQTMRELREKYGLTLREMARRLDYTAPYLVDLEYGRRTWTKSLMKRFNDAVKSNGATSK